MVWRLPKSRGLFFARTGENSRLGFWATEVARLAELGIDRDFPSPVLAWDPSAVDSRSNCPELHETVVWLTTRVAPEWRDRAGSIYAGRTSRNVDTAFGEHNVHSGMVAISRDYSLAIAAYVGVYARYLRALDFRFAHGTASAEQVLAGLHGELDTLIDAFHADPADALLRGPTWVSELPSAEHVEAAHHLIRASETWVVAHELAHHILRHGSHRRDDEARKAVRGYLSAPALAVEVEGMSRGQVYEVEADVLGFLLTAGHFVGEDGMAAVVTALNGSFLALIAIAHINGEWRTAPQDSHPGCLVRIAVLAKLANLLYHDVAFDPDGRATLPRASGVLVSFAAWAEGSGRLRGGRQVTDGATVRAADLPAVLLLHAHVVTQLDLLGWDDPTPLLMLEGSAEPDWGAAQLLRS